MSIATDSPREGTAAASPSSTTQAILRWLHESAGGQRRLDYAMSALDWCRRLPKLADRVPATTWQRLLNHLLKRDVLNRLADDEEVPAIARDNVIDQRHDLLPRKRYFRHNAYIIAGLVSFSNREL